MTAWIIRNYFKLSKFMNIKIYPFGLQYGLLWRIEYKVSYDKLTPEQKNLSDELSQRMKKAIGISR